MATASRWIIGVESLALVVFIYAARHADSFLPERGGTGDVSQINFWSACAGIAFYSLIVLSIVGFLTAWLRVPRGKRSLGAILRLQLHGSTGFAIFLPWLGLVVAYVGILFFP